MRNYWLDLFSAKTWQEFIDAGASVSGFRSSRRKTVQQIRPSDYLLCYLTGASRWVGLLEAVSEPFEDETPIWEDDDFPCRVRVKPIAMLTPETAVPVLDMKEELSIFKDMKAPYAWTGHLRSSPAKWKQSDAEAVVKAVLEARDNPVVRPIEPAKLRRRPTPLNTKIGLVTVPETEEEAEKTTADTVAAIDEPTLHQEVQCLLVKLGGDIGLDVWVARNDRGRIVNGNRLQDLPKVKKELPLQFDEATNRTIELIDVLWLRGNAIVAAFEIECTTSIYSGLLRMSDLVAMQPNLNIPLYLVAPDERRDKVLTEVNRPTFSRLHPPLNQVCRFISIPALKERVAQVAPVIRYLKPEFLEELSETCQVE